MRVAVLDMVGPICVDPEDAPRLREAIRSAMAASPGVVEVDFSGVTHVTSMFLNLSIGRLYGEFPDIESRLRAVGLHDEAVKVLDLVKRNARRFYSSTPEQQTALAHAPENS